MVGIGIQLMQGFESVIALCGEIPNTIATVSIALAYMACIILWNRDPGRWQSRMRNLGRMALSNYLVHTLPGMLILGVLLEDNSRKLILVFVLCVWAAQLFWTERWLSRYRFAPIEWLWRVATYWKVEPNRSI
ncbi:hypothetical protein AB833_00925 [Chromatiales bacterium (ex Bugula neritina AB1)]|nr:hypothetical protein AB833_00925 [Chromatiales bacterium (ex Bugula neritina AB1)]